MNAKQIVTLFPTMTLLVFAFSITAHSTWYESEIIYQEAVTKLLKRGDITWGDKPDYYYRFGGARVSADGSKVLFTGTCEFCVTPEVRPFLVNPDGSGLEDLSGMLPPDITTRWSGWRNMIINDNASRIFFRSYVETGYYDDQYLYMYNVATSTRSLAVDQQFGQLNYDWYFRINKDGTKVYLDKFDDGYDPVLQKNKKGLFYALTGATKQWYLDVDTLVCESGCGNLNLMKVLGVSVLNDRTYFQWNSDYLRSDGLYHIGLWYTTLSGNAELLTDEHYYIGNGDGRGISNTAGTKMIYNYRHEYGEGDTNNKLAVVQVPSGVEQVVGWTSGLNGFSAHMSRSGRYILTRGEYGDFGTYYQTMIDLDTGKSRDTWSYSLPSQWGSTSNITEDDRYYFYALDGWPNDSEAVAGLYRIDMQTTGDASAPYVTSIAFNAPTLADLEEVTISVRATVTDPQGRDNIERVILVPLVEGQEKTPWTMGREPLAFPTGDPGSTVLYDDGTHGDETSGDGIFSFDGIATRKTGREETGYNTWYLHYSLPAPVGIRIIVKDKDNNYAIADTELLITDHLVASDQFSWILFLPAMGGN